MNTTFRIISDKSRYIVAALLVAFSVFVPMLASAAQVTERSITLSSATKGATAVTYSLEFTTPTAGAQAIVVDFCSNSPIVGATCTAPTGMVATAATVPTAGYSKTSSTASKVVLAKTAATTAGEDLAVAIAGVTNSSAAGTVYARILTYADTAAAAGYIDGATTGSPIDTGSVAFALTDAISVSGDVLETLSFCVAGEAIPVNCNITGLDAPTLSLGEDLGNGVKALAVGTVSTGDLFTQVSTNAVNGAVVRLKNSTAGCGGLLRPGEGTAAQRCGIGPALLADVTTNGNALFGVKAVAVAGGEGAFDVANANYNAANYRMNYVNGDATGVTSVYGDEFLNTANAPALNKNATLTFGATIANNTPAGSYSADLNLIATGKF